MSHLEMTEVGRSNSELANRVPRSNVEGSLAFGGSIPPSSLLLCPYCNEDAGIKIIEWLAFDEGGKPIGAKVECLDCFEAWVEYPHLNLRRLTPCTSSCL